MIDARVADVHLVMRTHGPALPEFLPEQFKSFGGPYGNVPEELGGGTNRVSELTVCRVVEIAARFCVANRG